MRGDDFPYEYYDELNYKCGDTATSREGDLFGQSNFLYSLLEPAVVRA